MGKIIGFFHGGITVRDLDKSLEFYRDGLGLNEKFDRLLVGPYLKTVLNLKFEAIRVAYLDIPGGGFIELLDYQGIERLPAASRPCDYGAGHFCFYVSKIDEIASKMFSMGYLARSESCVDITEGPNKGARSLYLLDPDGYPIELFQRPGDN
jgi:lactoylglutathione lyase